MKKTLLLLASCLALTAAVAQRPAAADDRYTDELSDRDLRSLSIPDPFDQRAALPNDAYQSQSAYNSGYGNPGAYGPSPWTAPNRLSGHQRRVYRRAFEDGFRTGYREGFRRLTPRRLARPLDVAEAGFAEGYYRGLREGRVAFASRYGNRYNDPYGRRDGYGNPWRY